MRWLGGIMTGWRPQPLELKLQSNFKWLDKSNLRTCVSFREPRSNPLRMFEEFLRAVHDARFLFDFSMLKRERV